MVHNEEKLDMVVIAMDDKALNWYQWWAEQRQELNWEEFKGALNQRFQSRLV